MQISKVSLGMQGQNDWKCKNVLQKIRVKAFNGLQHCSVFLTLANVAFFLRKQCWEKTGF